MRNLTSRVKKLTSRWVPYDLSDKNRKERFEVYRENFAKFQDKIGGCVMLLQVMSLGLFSQVIKLD